MFGQYKCPIRGKTYHYFKFGVYWLIETYDVASNHNVKHDKSSGSFLQIDNIIILSLKLGVFVVINK